MKIKSRHLGPLILAFFVIGIAGTMALNIWNTSGRKEPARYSAGEFAGQYDPSDIRGSYSFADINKAFEVPVEDLAKAFGFTEAADPAALRAKDIEGTYGKMEGGELGTDSLRLFVAYYIGRPYTSEEDTLLPGPAVSILKAKTNLTEEQEQGLKEITISLPKVKPSPPEGSAESPTEHQATEEFKMRGKTTFNELLEYGIKKEEIEQILGMPMGREAETVRDFVVDKGMEFSEIKSKFEQLIESKK